MLGFYKPWFCITNVHLHKNILKKLPSFIVHRNFSFFLLQQNMYCTTTYLAWQVPNTRHGGLGLFQCKDGFLLKGQNTTRCDFGNWTGESPRCELVYCNFPGYIIDGKVSNTLFRNKMLVPMVGTVLYLMLLINATKFSYFCNKKSQKVFFYLYVFI